MTCDFQQCGMCDQQRLRPACAYAQSDQSLCLSLDYSTSVKLLIEYHFEFLSLKGGSQSSSESTLVKMPHCWKSHNAPYQNKVSCEKNFFNSDHMREVSSAKSLAIPIRSSAVSFINSKNKKWAQYRTLCQPSI